MSNPIHIQCPSCQASFPLSGNVLSSVREELTGELKGLRKELDENRQALTEAREIELAVRAEKRKVEEEKEEMALEVARKIDEERATIRNQARQSAMEEGHLRLAEKEKTIASLKEKIEEAQRRADLGSQQLQGDVLEVDLENRLRNSFPRDLIQPVATGTRGADILQKVLNPTGCECGSILYETKRTRSWQNAWITKLKSDMEIARADIGVIVSETLPKEFRDSFGLKDGLWISNPASAVPLAHALRASLEKVALARGHQNQAREKMELLYEYLTGNEFRQRVEMLVETFTSMREELNRERSYMVTRWNKREKHITLVIDGMAGMVGDVQALSGDAVGEIPALEMENLDDAA